METSGTSTIADGQKAAARLLEDVQRNRLDWNEAETRFQIIDRIIVECLGWPKDAVRLEQPQARAYSDYELGLPRRAIWEAKREGRTFELPANPGAKPLGDLPSILALGGEASDAVQQVQGYCSGRGVEVGVATNGHQLIAFLATRTDGVPPLDGRCLVINGYEQLVAKFPLLWQMLSPAGIAERRLHRFLSIGEERLIPPKMSDELVGYPQYRFRNDLQSSLRTIAELLIEDVTDQPEVEQQFYEQCYSESGALSQHALISKQMLSARYAVLFNRAEAGPTVAPVAEARGKPVLTPEVMAEALLQRPIVLLGDVGVGKTAFLKHLSYVSAFQEFKDAIYIYIDLGSTGALSADLNEFVLGEVEAQLFSKFSVDVYEGGFVRAIYHGEIERFKRGIFGPLQSENPTRYDERLMDFLQSKIVQRDQHLRQSISHLALGRKQQVIVALDNVDQRDYDTQQRAYVIAQNLAKDWRAAVFIALRPQTFYQSKQVGTMTAYPLRVFTIAPPRVDLVIERRLKFALNMAEGRIPFQRLTDIGLKLGNIAVFLRALLYSLGRNEELVEFLSNITGGNIRAVVDLVAKFIGSANVDAQHILEIMEKNGKYVVPVHEFWKASLLGDFSYYDPVTSIALNLFAVVGPNPSEHFLAPMVLAYLDFDGPHRSKEGFVEADKTIEEMQNWGFTQAATEDVLRRLNNKKLIETAQRVTFAEDHLGIHGDMPAGFRLTTIGAYHLKRWIAEFSYLDAMSYDTPILDASTRDAIRPAINSLAIGDRYRRALAFRSYLTEAWHQSNAKPRYFDWSRLLPLGQRSFERVRKAVEGGNRN